MRAASEVIRLARQGEEAHSGMRASGVVEGLVTMLDHPASRPRARHVAAAALWALAGSSGTTHCRIVEAGGVAALMRLLEAASKAGALETLEEALGALGNLVSHPSGKDELLEAGKAAFVADLLYTGSPPVKAGAAGLLWAVADRAPQAGADTNLVAIATLLQAGVPIGLVRLLREGDRAGRREAMGALSALLQSGEAAQRAIKDAGALHAMIHLLLRDGDEELIYAAKSIACLASGAPAVQAEVGDSRALGRLVSLCGDPVEKTAVPLQAAAAECLGILVMDPENSVQVRTRQGIPRCLRRDPWSHSSPILFCCDRSFPFLESSCRLLAMCDARSYPAAAIEVRIILTAIWA